MVVSSCFHEITAPSASWQRLDGRHDARDGGVRQGERPAEQEVPGHRGGAQQQDAPAEQVPEHAERHSEQETAERGDEVARAVEGRPEPDDGDQQQYPDGAEIEDPAAQREGVRSGTRVA